MKKIGVIVAVLMLMAVFVAWTSATSQTLQQPEGPRWNMAVDSTYRQTRTFFMTPDGRWAFVVAPWGCEAPK